MPTVTLRSLDPTPPRPDQPLKPPHDRLTIVVDVEAALLAKPVLTVSRLLAREAGCFAHVEGDDQRFSVSVALPDDEPSTSETAEAWVRWCVHNAGIRGTVQRGT